MARKAPHLSAVPGDETPPVTPGEATKAAKTITQAATDGTRLELLIALRARVATAVQDPNTPARDLAALSRRLIEIAKDVEAIETALKQEAVEASDGAEDEDFDAEAL